ncbi:uncharacterized protein LOC118755212 [Rhagoletis pomonella]|uniref:uncharacterized protein LOC118755212 n=1 Tax=Rhagoletis pomonella TaxID=28610 RepID=UPI0017804462|nr:uncharacterized protein LOC118755212 [Rhagoletis pomonella]
MRGDVEFRTRYREEMSKYFERGYARKLNEAEVSAPDLNVWYLPHFAVFNPHKPEKIRIVFDASASVANVSLNSALLKGPEQAQSLIRILLQFRQGRIGVSADIREMFSQIKIRQNDQHAQRFLWRDGDQSRPIEEYAMTSLIFGAVCSPCIAEYIKNKNAKEFRAQFPDAVSTIINKHYVDDLVASFNEPEEAVRICQEIVKINRHAGFELRNFISNCREVEETMNQQSTSPAREAVSMERNGIADKVLGLHWNTKEDTFGFHTQFHRVPQEVLNRVRAPAKRELLRIVMAVFDPFGMLSNFLIITKLLIQETWKSEIEWDDILPKELGRKWSQWWQEFDSVRQFTIPRCYSPYVASIGKVEVHMFVDASQVAFAAVGYLRVLHEGNVDVSFVMGKSRTAPTKLMSIPRLELQSAVLGTRLFKLIQESHEFTIERAVFWSDSQTVLQWIHSSQRKYKAFVGHRISEILTSTAPEQWRWVPTGENAADAATRPSCPPKFDTNNRWVKGPDFLKYHEQYWPALTLQPEYVLPEEIKTEAILLVQPHNSVIDFSRFGSFLKLRRTTAWVMRAVNLFRKQPRSEVNSSTSLNVTEIEAAENMICKLVQLECYANEISD